MSIQRDGSCEVVKNFASDVYLQINSHRLTYNPVWDRLHSCTILYKNNELEVGDRNVATKLCLGHDALLFIKFLFEVTPLARAQPSATGRTTGRSKVVAGQVVISILPLGDRMLR